MNFSLLSIYNPFFFHYEALFNPLTTMSDQEGISPYNINTISSRQGEYKLIQYQILQTNITRTVWQIVRRITNEILGIKGLKYYFRPESVAHLQKKNHPFSILRLLTNTQTIFHFFESLNYNRSGKNATV